MVQVVKALQAIVAQRRQSGLWPAEAEVALTPTELAGLLKEKLGREKLSTRGLATLLNPLGFYSRHTWGEDRGRRYHLSAEVLNELAARYGEQPQEEEESFDGA